MDTDLSHQIFFTSEISRLSKHVLSIVSHYTPRNFAVSERYQIPSPQALIFRDVYLYFDNSWLKVLVKSLIFKKSSYHMKC